MEGAMRGRVRALIETPVVAKARAALGAWQRIHRNDHWRRQLVGAFGALVGSLRRARLRDGDSGATGWRSQIFQAHERLTKPAEAIMGDSQLVGTNPRRVSRALSGLFGGKVGKNAMSHAWRKVKTDWECWQARDLSEEDFVRKGLVGTGVKARLGKRVTSVPPLAAVALRWDGQKELLSV